MDILKEIFKQSNNVAKRGKVLRVSEQSVSVIVDNGVRVVPRGFVSVKAGDEVTVHGGQIVGKRRPVNTSKTVYRA